MNRRIEKVESISNNKKLNVKSDLHKNHENTNMNYKDFQENANKQLQKEFEEKETKKQNLKVKQKNSLDLFKAQYKVQKRNINILNSSNNNSIKSQEER